MHCIDCIRNLEEKGLENQKICTVCSDCNSGNAISLVCIFIAFFMPIFYYLPFKRKHIFISTLVMIASFFALYNQMFKAVSFLQIGKRDYTEFYSSSGEAINIISLYFVFIYVLIFAIGTLSLVYYNKKKRNNQSSGLAVTDESGFSNSFLLYMVLILAVCRITGLKINIMARMTYYFMPFVYVLLPRSINCFKNINNKKIVKLTMYFFYDSCFYLANL